MFVFFHSKAFSTHVKQAQNKKKDQVCDKLRLRSTAFRLASSILVRATEKVQLESKTPSMIRVRPKGRAYLAREG